MGLPKNMPPIAVGSIQTSLRKGLPAPIDVLRRILPGGGRDGAPCGFYDTSSFGQGSAAESPAAPDSRTDSPAVDGPGSAMERRRETTASRRFSDSHSTAPG